MYKLENKEGIEMNSDVNKCNRGGELFDCICGDEYYKSIDDFQQNINSKVLEYDSEKLSQVISHQNTNDQRLCSRLVKVPFIHYVSNCTA